MTEGFNTDSLLVKYRQYCQGNKGALTPEEYKEVQDSFDRVDNIPFMEDIMDLINNVDE